MATKQIVYTVDHAEAWMTGNVLRVTASGTTRTGGWSDPELVPSATTGPMQRLDFLASPPTGPSTDVISPISVTYQSGPLRPPFPNEVRIQAETNDVTTIVDRATGGKPYTQY